MNSINFKIAQTQYDYGNDISKIETVIDGLQQTIDDESVERTQILDINAIYTRSITNIWLSFNSYDQSKDITTLNYTNASSGLSTLYINDTIHINQRYHKILSIDETKGVITLNGKIDLSMTPIYALQEVITNIICMDNTDILILVGNVDSLTSPLSIIPIILPNNILFYKTTLHVINMTVGSYDYNITLYSSRTACTINNQHSYVRLLPNRKTDAETSWTMKLYNLNGNWYI